MDTLHRENEFINNMWKFMKSSQSQPDRGSEAFWDRTQDEANQLSIQYAHIGFAADWIVSFLRFLDGGE